MTVNRFRWGSIEENPLLPAGEVAVDTTTGQIKVGNGRDRWADMPDDNTDLPATIDGGQP